MTALTVAPPLMKNLCWRTRTCLGMPGIKQTKSSTFLVKQVKTMSSRWASMSEPLPLPLESDFPHLRSLALAFDVAIALSIGSCGLHRETIGRAQAHRYPSVSQHLTGRITWPAALVARSCRRCSMSRDTSVTTCIDRRHQHRRCHKHSTAHDRRNSDAPSRSHHRGTAPLLRGNCVLSRNKFAVSLNRRRGPLPHGRLLSFVI